jgi:hypothetical protein
MISFQMTAGMGQWGRNLTIAVFALTLAACAPVDDSIGSRLSQPAAGMPPQQPIEAGDIAIVGQEVAHSIMELPVVANASVPPLVQFTGVTSIVDKPIDTDPYTELLRDRLLLLTREKLRFVEHTLPPYVPPTKKGKKAASEPAQNNQDADYQILAELRGHAENEFYKIQIEFVDIHTNDVLFNGLYRIRREADVQPSPEASENNQAPPDSAAPAPPQAPQEMTTPTTTSPAPAGNESL